MQLQRLRVNNFLCCFDLETGGKWIILLLLDGFVTLFFSSGSVIGWSGLVGDILLLVVLIVGFLIIVVVDCDGLEQEVKNE